MIGHQGPRRRGRRISLATALAAALLAGGCTAAATAGPVTSTPSVPPAVPTATSPSGSATPPSDQGSPTPGAGQTAAPTVSKVLVVMMENHSLDQMRSEMPATYALAQQYGYATHYQAIRHPSLPNYLAIASGSTQGVTDDNPPADHQLSGHTVLGDALDAGRTAKVYAEGMPSPCAPANGGDRYAVRHNPWAYFVDERAQCQANDVPADRLAADTATGSLPDVGLLIPNTCDDAHDCPLGVADAWFADRVRELQTGPDWHNGRLAIVLTADEDDHHQDNTVLTVVIHPSQHHRVVDTPLTHYSLSRLLAEVAGTQPLGEADGAPSLGSAFGLTLLTAR